MRQANGVRSKARKWVFRGTITAVAGVLVVIALAPVPDVIFLSGYTATILAAGWGLKCLQGSTSLQETMDGLYGVIDQLNARIALMLAGPPADPERPVFTVHQGGRD